MAVHAIDEANRCLQCKKPMCQQGCPIHTPIPAMIKALKEGGLEEAGAMLFSNNPMSLVCSLVCNHERQCEGHCVLGRKGQPVHVSSIENYISEKGGCYRGGACGYHNRHPSDKEGVQCNHF